MEDFDDSFDEVLANLDVAAPAKAPEESKTSNNIPAATEVEKSKYSNAIQIQVHPNQRGNPILKGITNVPWEFNSQIIPDYIVGKTACVLFLSLRYHNLKPEILREYGLWTCHGTCGYFFRFIKKIVKDYIHDRLKQLGNKYELRILLVNVDVKEPQNALKHLTRICLLANLTLICSWGNEEAGKIIETYHQFENRPPDLIMEKNESDNYQKVVNALTSVKSVNKTDAMTLLANFGTLENLVQASEYKLNSCPGLGVRKAQKIIKVFNEPFLK